MTNFADLVRRTDWDPIAKAFLGFYGGEESWLEPYRRVLATLKTLEPVRSTMRIHLRRYVSPDEDDGPGVDLFGHDGTLIWQQDRFRPISGHSDLEWAHRECPWGLSYHPWREWLGMAIDPKTRQTFSDAEIVAHSLWEMTWNGFDEASIEESRLKLMRGSQSDEYYSVPDDRT